MNCPECQDLLQRRLDGDPSGGPEADRHLAECAECRERAAAAPLLLEGVRALPRPCPPADLTRQVVAAVLRDREKRRVRGRIRLAITAALAASILVLFLVGLAWRPGGAGDGNLALVENEPKKQPPPPEPAPAKVEPPEQTPEEIRVALADVTNKLTDRALEEVRALVSAATPAEVMGVPKLGPLDTDAPPSIRQASQDVTDSLQTVTRSARRAFDYFSRELPMLDLPTNQ